MENSNTKMFLFARWISTCYADEHLDSNGKHSIEEGHNAATDMSVLNRKDGYWWKEQLVYFNTEVYPNYVKRGTVEDTIELLKDIADE